MAKSPANDNYKVAYTFGVYDDKIKDVTNMHIIGGNAENNTFHTIENTYVGSYFLADDINSTDVLAHNMKYYLQYVSYLINPARYSNPTLEDGPTPLMNPECGFYHPDLGVYTVVPESKLINEWILKNPGYNHDGEGSLNWMIENYKDWLN